MSASASAADEERSEAHIDRLFAEVVDAFANARFHETHSLRSILAEYLEGELTLTQIHKARQTLAAFLQQKNFCAYTNVVCAPISRAAHRFITGLRRYFVSDKMRKEIERGVTFRSGANKRKFDVYLACTDLRAHACETYRRLVNQVDQMLRDDANLKHHDRIAIMNAFDSQLRCEACGKDHVRPGLAVNRHIKGYESDRLRGM